MLMYVHSKSVESVAALMTLVDHFIGGYYAKGLLDGTVQEACNVTFYSAWMSPSWE